MPGQRCKAEFQIDHLIRFRCMLRVGHTEWHDWVMPRPNMGGPGWGVQWEDNSQFSTAHMERGNQGEEAMEE